MPTASTFCNGIGCVMLTGVAVFALTDPRIPWKSILRVAFLTLALVLIVLFL